MSTKVLIIEDHDDFRDIVKSYLSVQGLSLEIFDSSTGELGVIKALRVKPDIILMDIRLPGINGIEAAAEIKKFLPQSYIVVLTMFETAAFRDVFKSDDVYDYIGKSELHDKLVPLIKKILLKKKVMTGVEEGL